MNRQKREEMLRGSSQHGTPKPDDRTQPAPPQREQVRGSKSGEQQEHHPERQGGKMPLPE